MMSELDVHDKGSMTKIFRVLIVNGRESPAVKVRKSAYFNNLEQ